ncbi:neck protein [uncultured Caudovirales phage]|uniref:Neck protein n=1 Tax=uncultured Caudovirales phage TaxID=2100421 RepID=A0A6J7WU57_9CAUD|nr:neck protein [uncultured Caudovirales phage]
MATPTTRSEFKEYCLRKLGKPVLEINVDDDQAEDRIDEALKYYYDYHFDGTEKQFYRHIFTAADMPDVVKEIVINDGGTGYSNTDTVTITRASGSIEGSGATATLTTYANGTISAITMTNNGSYYRKDPIVTINTSTGSGASVSGYVGGYVTVPQNIIGVVNIFDIGDYLATNNIFNIRYQIALNDLYTLTYQSMVPYYMAFQQIQLLEQLLVGKQPIRYNRNTNRLYVDMNWNKVEAGQYLVMEAYQIVDPNKFPDVWGDRWLQRYATALIKKQWGTNLTKFNGIQLPGGVTFNGEKIYNDAHDELDKLEAEMSMSYSLPAYDMIG